MIVFSTSMNTAPKVKTIEKDHKRCFVIGDLHGAYDETMILLETLDVNDDDLVIFVGDLVDRGVYPDKCVDIAMKHHSVMGNHESRHVSYESDFQKGKLNKRINPTHEYTRTLLNETHHVYMSSLPHVIRVPQHNIAVVHAGAYPGVPLESQDVNHLLHIQMINPPNTKSHWPSKAPSDWVFWATVWDGPETLVFGHTVTDDPIVGEKVVGVDCGAVFGCGLVAFEARSRTFTRTPAKTSTRRYAFPVYKNIRAFS